MSTVNDKKIKFQELHELYKNKKIKKPLMQRMVRWELFPDKNKKNITNNLDYIKFLIQWKHNFVPLIFYENEEPSKYYIIDGNNRLNAILDFINEPTKYLIKFLDFSLFNDEEISIINTYNIFNIERYLKDKYREDKIKNEKYDNLKDKIDDLKILDVEILSIVFKSNNNKMLFNIFNDINRTGVKLTENDLYASTTMDILYNVNDIPRYYHILEDIIVKVYSYEYNTEELLYIDKNELEFKNGLSLYQVLLSFQYYLSDNFSTCLEPQNNSEKSSTFWVIMLYKKYCEYFGIEEPFKNKVNIMNKFLNMTFDNYKIMDKVLNTIYNKKIKKNNSLNIKNIVKIIMFIIENNVDIIDKEIFMFKIIFHFNLVKYYKSIVKKKKITTPTMYNNILEYRTGGGVDDIKECNIDIEEIIELVYEIHEIETEHQDISYKSPFKQMLLSIKYENEINNINKVNIDHLIPKSTFKNTNKNKNRLGNLLPISENDNKTRGRNEIRYINSQSQCIKYDIDYHLYKQIQPDNNQIIFDNYDRFCEEREKLMFKMIRMMITPID